MAEYYTANLPAETGGLTGLETMPADSNAAPGNPQQIAVSVSQLAQFNRGLAQAGITFKNLLQGGDATTNPFQRGTSATGITNTATYGPDRFFAYGASTSSISVSQSANTSVPSFGDAFLFGRGATNTDVNPINLAQILDPADIARIAGQSVTFSFWAASGANYSGGNLSVSLIDGTDTVSNTTAAKLIAGTWAGQTTLATTNNQSGSTTAVGTAPTQAITSTATRYSFTAVVPATATQLAVVLGYTPTGTAGSADNVILWGLQLEVGTSPSAFEHRSAGLELMLCQRYYVRFNEPATANVPLAQGMVTATNVETFVLPTPVPMRAVPTVTVAAGNLKVTTSTGAYTAVSTLAAATSTPNALITTAANTNTFGQAALLVAGASSSGYIAGSADF